MMTLQSIPKGANCYKRMKEDREQPMLLSALERTLDYFEVFENRDDSAEALLRSYLIFGPNLGLICKRQDTQAQTLIQMLKHLHTVLGEG